MKNSTTQKKYALISVYDKSGIIELARILASLRYSIISTGGTAKKLKDSGIEVIAIENMALVTKLRRF